MLSDLATLLLFTLPVNTIPIVELDGTATATKVESQEVMEPPADSYGVSAIATEDPGLTDEVH